MPYYNRDPKKDHNFDNHLHYGDAAVGVCVPRKQTSNSCLAKFTESDYFQLSPASLQRLGSRGGSFGSGLAL